VVGHRLCSYPRRAQEEFPRDARLGELGVESYVGASLFDSAGNPTGLLAVMVI
jgi:hypothetical protein